MDDALHNFALRARAQWQLVLAGARHDGEYQSYNSKGEFRPAVRHLCDAIEIAAGFNCVPSELDISPTIERLQALQAAESGLFPDPFSPPTSARPLTQDGLALYNVLAVGYALECLGSAPALPIRVVETHEDTLYAWLNSLPWHSSPWAAGAVVDSIGTSIYFNAKYHHSGHLREALFSQIKSINFSYNYCSTI